ncbi:c-type cytochrome [Chiayiivirga flava]|uniref:Cytochrome c553 n=1 Tax=Chiayiivirga flava TaxID=659595 RepID=A0A7W8D292_9GAMM|nr:c-type cytochrome [Chiayiivirga flava]MBB5206554.1 cytochrome c553 [Chiayiivirga flava]
MTKVTAVLWLLLAPGSLCASGIDLRSHCLDCHRPHQRRGEVPLIEGQQRDYLEHQLRRFRARHRDTFPMSALVSATDDATLRDLASRLSARAWRDAGAPRDAAAARRGADAATRRDCAGCHGADFTGIGDIARLAGQHPGYLARQIEGFGRGDRYHPPSGTGAPMHTISAAEAADLGAYFGTLRVVAPGNAEAEPAREDRTPPDPARGRD